jgi:hypothetical protein
MFEHFSPLAKEQQWKDLQNKEIRDDYLACAEEILVLFGVLDVSD